MDDRTRTLIITTLVLLIIIALIGGIIFYVTRIIRGRQVPRTASTSSPQGTIRMVSPSPTTTPSTTQAPSSPQGTPRTQTLPANTKRFKSSGFELVYPQNWGILTCNNSKNIELDPNSNVDQINVVCDYAQKPITILINGSNCQGETISKGGITSVKSVGDFNGGKEYKWCTKTTPSLEITHRVNPNGGRATSKEDVSTQIEDIVIPNLRFGTAI